MHRNISSIYWPYPMKGQVLVDGDGEKGLTVLAYLELPTDEGLVDGEEFNIPVAASTTTQGNGNFSLTLDHGEIPELFIDEEGAVNFTVHVLDDGEIMAVHSSTVYAPEMNHKGRRNGPWTTENVDGDLQNARSLRVQIEISGSQSFEVHEEGLAPEEFAEDLAEPDIRDLETEPIENQPAWFCSTTDLGRVDEASTILTIAGSNSSYISYDYEFNQNSSVSDSFTVGVGFNWTNSSAGWSQNGTIKVTSGLQLSYPPATASNGNSSHRAFRTNTVYNKYRYSCTGSTGTTTYYQVRPKGITGAWTNNASYKTPTHCSIVGPGISMKVSSGRVTNLSNGVTVSGPLGSGSNGTLRLSIKNTLDGGNSHQLTFTNTANRTNKYVCGSFSEPNIGNPGRLAGDWTDRG